MPAQVNYGPCGCCGDNCGGWYCCPVTGEVTYVANCAELDQLPPCEDVSGSGSGDGTPCSSCFGPGTPHPDSSTPASLTATYPDQGGITDSFVNDGNWDYQCGDSNLEGLLNASAHLCAYFCQPEVLCTALVLNDGVSGPLSETIELTITSCDPFVATGTSVNFGAVIVTE